MNFLWFSSDLWDIHLPFPSPMDALTWSVWNLSPHAPSTLLLPTYWHQWRFLEVLLLPICGGSLEVHDLAQHLHHCKKLCFAEKLSLLTWASSLKWIGMLNMRYNRICFEFTMWEKGPIIIVIMLTIQSMLIVPPLKPLSPTFSPLSEMQAGLGGESFILCHSLHFWHATWAVDIDPFPQTFLSLQFSS